MKELIAISSDVMRLKGIGEEWLMSKDGSLIIARFYDGNLSKNNPIDPNEPTIDAVYEVQTG